MITDVTVGSGPLVTDVQVKELRPGEWEWAVKVSGKLFVGGNAHSCKQALRYAVSAVRSMYPRPAPWWRRWLRKEAKQ